jgi:hypothetical protein
MLMLAVMFRKKDKKDDLMEGNKKNMQTSTSRNYKNSVPSDK